MTPQSDTLAADRRRYRWHPRIATRTLGGNAFILLGGRMLHLNETATRMWELFESGASAAAVAARIADEFDTTGDVALADTDRFVRDLLERELLVVLEESVP
jgi:hypothetical protein